ncbi:cyclic nucleotide-binding domain-containing protein [bacterium]|nr:cyclic nucleotide-binding domain-containing protein [bacterium]
MLSTIEKVIILRGVAIFSDIPEEELAKLAVLAEEEEFTPHEAIIQKGEMGTCMYIVVNGKVRVHDGEKTIVELADREVFGEMAALDPEPRSADVTAIQETLTLRIDQEPLMELVSENAGFLQRIVSFLCNRIRADLARM